MGEWLHKIGRREDPFCDECGEGVVEDGGHLVLHCPRFQDERETLQDAERWEDLDRPVWVEGKKGKHGSSFSEHCSGN